MSKQKKKMTAKEFEARFDRGESVLQHFDLTRATRPGHVKKRVNVDFPVWMINRLSLAASRNGVARQALIKNWLADRLKAEAA
jgi:hypothetical protein